jgi:hypothetical protein
MATIIRRSEDLANAGLLPGSAERTYFFEWPDEKAARAVPPHP